MHSNWSTSWSWPTGDRKTPVRFEPNELKFAGSRFDHAQSTQTGSFDWRHGSVQFAIGQCRSSKADEKTGVHWMAEGSRENSAGMVLHGEPE